MKKKILFLYPAVKNIPNGGLKNIFDYSNRLVADGHEVIIVYAATFESVDVSIQRKIKSLIKYLYLKICISRTGYTWFTEEKKFKELFIWNAKAKCLPKSDVYIATAVCTAPYISSLSLGCIDMKYYYIQGYEKFIVPEDGFIRSTYRLPLKKIVISNWLKKIVNGEGQNCELIPNGFDFQVYRLTIPIERKDKYTISMLYHINPRKDVKTGIQAIKKVKNRIPQIRLVLFGAYNAPAGLEKWMTYYKMPTQETHLEINNKAAIYVGCSQIEGWGLTVGEAMMCGQAVVCTDNDGYKEMAQNDYNALISPICDTDSLANNIIRLIENDELRYRIAKNGMESIKAFNIEDSYSHFRDYITKE